MRKCDSCGKLYQESKDIFCPHCGAVALKQCTHSSSFDSNKYDRGEIYKNNNPQYQQTTYNKGTEPHTQRGNAPYNKSANTGEYAGKTPQFNLPDFTKMLSKGKGNSGKPIGIIIFVIIIAFNGITALMGANEVAEDTGLWEDATESFLYEDLSELYTVVEKATIEVPEDGGKFNSFTIEINSMGFDDYLTEFGYHDISSEELAKEILFEETSVDMLICSFSKKIIPEEKYDSAIEDSDYCTGDQIDGKCKYEFFYDFDYDEIVHIGSGVSFYLNNGMYINAELPFSAFSVSEDGKITYYTSYADSETAWNTVFSECSNEQTIDRAFVIDFVTGE